MKFSIIAVALSILAGNAYALHRCSCQLGSSCLSFSQVEDNQSCSAFCKASFNNAKTC
ncbi:hypothetical protein CGMCC3_g10470 [Colletotrichum fructicola]|nr:uncharacterized protein CGMCC3_g10470 [Colletotrichum fructicola]KAE9573682.1 hypothetical protein CGMCC3_g10470 [Colletotrichum fructicola]